MLVLLIKTSRMKKKRIKIKVETSPLTLAQSYLMEMK